MDTNIEKDVRLLSLDTLRGFDMAILVGFTGVVEALSKVIDWKLFLNFEKQFHHVKWEGFRFFDLIFPLFMFISGVAIPYAIHNKLEKGVKHSVLLKKIFVRFLVLVVFGIIYNGALKKGFTDVRYASVLAQIGFGYFFAAFICLYTTKLSKLLFWLFSIMSCISIVQLFVPVPGFGAGTFEKKTSINTWVDQIVLGGYDPEGILCMVSAIAITLMGVLVGRLVRTESFEPTVKINYMVAAGIVLIGSALVISPFYPIIKKMWTVPFIMLTGGISIILFSIFYFIIDVKKYSQWTLFFRIFGMNSITIYMGSKIINFNGISNFFLGWSTYHISEDWGLVFISIGAFVLQWALLNFLYKKNIFLRI